MALTGSHTDGSTGHVSDHNLIDAAIAGLRVDVDGLTAVVAATLEQFGAAGDGVTDDTAAFNAAVAWANSLNPGVVDAANVVGALIELGPKRYRIDGPVTAIRKSGVNVRGAGENATVLLLSNAGATFSIGDGTSDLVVGGGFSDMKLEYLAAPGASASVFHVEYASRLRFENLLLVNVGQLADLGASAVRFASSCEFVLIRGYVANVGRPMIDARYGAGVSLTNCRLFVGGVGAPTINRVSSMSTVAGTVVVRLGVGSWDTVHVTGCFFERFERGVSVAAGTSVIVSNIFVTATYFDYHAREAIYLNTSAASGGIYGVRVSNCWLASWDDAAVTLSGTGTVRGVTIEGGQIPSAGTHGINIGAAARDVKVSGVEIQGVNRTNVNASGVVVLGGSHIDVRGVTAGYDSTWAGFAWQAYAGVYVVADVDHFTVADCDMDGTAGGYTFEANAAGSTNRQAHHNRGNVGYDGYVALSTPATGATVTNTTPAAWDLHVYGGTVTVVTKNGTGITGMTSGHLRVGPGESFALTYSSAPTVTRFVQA